MVFNNIRKSSIKESHATPTVFIKDQNAVKMRQICQNAKKNSDEKSMSNYKLISV